MKYLNLSAIEKDLRVIGLEMARMLGAILNIDYTEFFDL